ncbi:hypothetical protein C8R43DRAFT_966714 [Mycena crocata]|nr:hypothetical protein C8R43DRAFT_966714 [Mycena crocata]
MRIWLLQHTVALTASTDNHTIHLAQATNDEDFTFLSSKSSTLQERQTATGLRHCGKINVLHYRSHLSPSSIEITMATPPPTYSAQIDAVEMDTGAQSHTEIGPTRDNSSDVSDTETDDSMPDLIPASAIAQDNVNMNNTHSATAPAAVTTLIQHIGSLSIANSVTNEAHPGRRASINDIPRRETTNTPVDAHLASDHAHITKLRGESRVANQAIREAVLDRIAETGRHQFNNNNRRGNTYRVHAPAHPSTNARLFALLERLNRVEIILRRLERLINLLTATQL